MLCVCRTLCKQLFNWPIFYAFLLHFPRKLRMVFNKNQLDIVWHIYTYVHLYYIWELQRFILLCVFFFFIQFIVWFDKLHLFFAIVGYSLGYMSKIKKCYTKNIWIIVRKDKERRRMKMAERDLWGERKGIYGKRQWKSTMSKISICYTRKIWIAVGKWERERETVRNRLIGGGRKGKDIYQEKQRYN